MTTLLDDPSTAERSTPVSDREISLSDGETSPSERGTTVSTDRIRHEMAAVRLSIHWPGTRKTLSRDQKDQAADTFGADGKLLSAGKKILDTKHPAWKACTRVRTQSLKLWHSLSLPWPEPGIRLIRRDDIGVFTDQATRLREELATAVRTLEAHYAELRQQARGRLGELYDPTDYPLSLSGCFAIDWDFPSVEAPAYLRDLCPALYREEQERVRSRFEEAARLAEEAFVAELSELVSHLAERLTAAGDGSPKVFRDTAITNLTEFFERFRRLNVTGNATLEELVGEAHRVLTGVGPQPLRERADLRQQVAAELAPIRESLDDLLITRPRRRLLRG